MINIDLLSVFLLKLQKTHFVCCQQTINAFIGVIIQMKLKHINKKESSTMTQNTDIAYNPMTENRVTVMSKSGFLPEPKISYVGDIIGIIISVFLIIGGASGLMVLRGTDSSPALVVVGFLFLAWDIFSMVKKSSDFKKAGEERHKRMGRMSMQENTVKTDGRLLPSPVNLRIICDQNISVFDYGARLNGSPMTRDAKSGEYYGTTWYVYNILNFSNLDLTVVFDAGAYAYVNAPEIVVRLFRDDKGNNGVDLPGNLMVIPTETPQPAGQLPIA